ncbi:MAG: FtsH protease activity modulator HflK, partial [Candidatus Tectomicrobia bacterium]|nr:FtsH protease activity modulator HflK [Candidatus Tectomicrobia bacterium]
MDWDEFRNRRISNGKFRGRPPFSIPKIDLPEMKPMWILIALATLFFLWLLTGFYIVSPDEQGVVLRFGKKINITDPGPHYHLPYPIEWVERPKVTEVKRIEIGFVTVNPGPPASYSDRPFESLMLTGDENIIDIDV